MRANSFVQISITSLTEAPNSAYALPLWGLEALLQLDDGSEVVPKRGCIVNIHPYSYSKIKMT